MRRQAVIAGCLAATWTTLVAGCLRHDLRAERPTPEELVRQRSLSRAAQDAIDRRDWPVAAATLEQLAIEAPESPETRNRLGRVYYALGDVRRAEASFRRALEIDPEYADSLIGLAQVERSLGRLDEALKHVESAIEITPNEAEAHLARGRILEELGRTDEALAAYFRAQTSDPGLAEALRRAAVIQLERTQNDQALARLTLALELDPTDSETRYQRGRASLAVGHTQEAVDDLRAAAASLPDRSDVLVHLALALERSSRPVDALAVAEQALSLAPDDPVARDLAGRLRR